MLCGNSRSFQLAMFLVFRLFFSFSFILYWAATSVVVLQPNIPRVDFQKLSLDNHNLFLLSLSLSLSPTFDLGFCFRLLNYFSPFLFLIFFELLLSYLDQFISPRFSHCRQELASLSSSSNNTNNNNNNNNNNNTSSIANLITNPLFRTKGIGIIYLIASMCFS